MRSKRGPFMLRKLSSQLGLSTFVASFLKNCGQKKTPHNIKFTLPIISKLWYNIVTIHTAM